MLSLYIHIPFCIRKCLYCGFFSTRYSVKSVEQYIAGLQLEASGYKEQFSKKQFETVYAGGGTPSALSPDQLDRLLVIIDDHFRIDNRAEFTAEMNPNTATDEKLGLLQARGVNRISLGIQSLSNEVLSAIGRLHTAQDAIDAFMRARRIGFKNIGIDLIYGIPGQTVKQWEDSLDAVIELKPEHISVYSLSLDEGSHFHRMAEKNRFSLPEEELVAQMYERAVIRLKSAGYNHYELSNFSLPGFECRHNLNYWERGEYLGIGPGAWSFIVGRRYSNIADVSEYSRRLSRGQTVVDSQETVTMTSAAQERLLLGLRLTQGLDLDQFTNDFGQDLTSRLELNAGPLRDAGLLRVADGRLKLTDRGMLLYNKVLAKLSL